MTDAVETVAEWTAPQVVEIQLGMEVTSYESADIDIVD